MQQQRSQFSFTVILKNVYRLEHNTVFPWSRVHSQNWEEANHDNSRGNMQPDLADSQSTIRDISLPLFWFKLAYLLCPFRERSRILLLLLRSKRKMSHLCMQLTALETDTGFSSPTLQVTEKSRGLQDSCFISSTISSTLNNTQPSELPLNCFIP